MPSYIADRRLYVTADRSEVVEEGDPRAAFLLAGKDCEIDSDSVAVHDLSMQDGKIVIAEVKAAPPPQNKMAPAPENKAPVEAGGSPDLEDLMRTWEEERGMTQDPRTYLNRFPDGPNADLAREIVEADEAS